ncbi:unnamed protein product [Allacma fusca]|uniref:Uncharacterized protein n=1 Tax=Allacma fusca TaxID=39272 RepID=A0A8J2L219_9HEXA|nr:unnamed protein product [Allacma fusca]
MAASSAAQFFNDLDQKPSKPQELNITPSGKIINGSDGLAPVKSSHKRSASNHTVKKKMNSNKTLAKPRTVKNASEKSGTESGSEAVLDATPSKMSSNRSRSRRLAKQKVSQNLAKTDTNTNIPNAEISTSKSKQATAVVAPEGTPGNIVQIPNRKKTLQSLPQSRSKSNEIEPGTSPSRINKRVSSAKVRSNSSRSEGFSKTKKNQAKMKLNRRQSKKNPIKGNKPNKVAGIKKKPENTKIAGKITTMLNPSRNTIQKLEPPFYTSITPEFFSKLKAVANATNTNNIATKKVEPVKLETLTAMLNAEADAKANNTPKKKRKSKPGKNSGYTFSQARDALSLGHVPLESNPLKIGDTLKKKGDPDVITSWKSMKKTHDSTSTSVGLPSPLMSSNKSILSGSGCHASASLRLGINITN